MTGLAWAGDVEEGREAAGIPSLGYTRSEPRGSGASRREHHGSRRATLQGAKLVRARPTPPTVTLSTCSLAVFSGPPHAFVQQGPPADQDSPTAEESCASPTRGNQGCALRDVEATLSCFSFNLRERELPGLFHAEDAASELHRPSRGSTSRPLSSSVPRPLTNSRSHQLGVHSVPSDSAPIGQ